jgi:hypothetical protein
MSIYASSPPMPPRYIEMVDVEDAIQEIPDLDDRPDVDRHKPTIHPEDIKSYPWKAVAFILLMVFLFLFRILYILYQFHIFASMGMAMVLTSLTYLFLRFL